MTGRLGQAARRLVLDTAALQLLAVVVVFAVGSTTIAGFSDASAIRSMLILAAFLGFAAAGQTLVVLLGGIDLSIPALVGAGNVMTAQLYGSSHLAFPLVVLAVVGFGAAVGAFSGLVSNVCRVPSLIVTLAVGSIVAGGILVWTNANVTGSAPASLGTFTSPASTTFGLSVPPLVVVWLAFGLLFELFLRRTGQGRRIYATGANPRAARLMLVREPAVWALCFAVSGAMAAVAGMLLAGFTGAGLFSVGDPYLFTTIAAVVVGGSSLGGGRGSYLRTILGAIVLIELSTMLIGYGLSAAAQEAVYGAILIAVVATYAREPSIRARI